MNPADAVLDKDAAGAYRHWRLERDADGIVWLTFDKAGASTNTFSKDVMEELAAIVDRLAAEQPKGLVIRSGKASGFIAGADVDEFTQIESVDDALAIVRRGWETFNRLAALPFPTVALVEGFCMGGGVELALACRYRIAVDVPGTRFALPEVMLGILPGWGGVKRLPGLVGPSAALDMMLTGRSIDARRAKKMGLVDDAVPPRVMENAARTIVREAPAPRTLPLMQRLMNGPLKRIVAAMARAQLETAREARALPGAVRDPRAVGEVRRRPVHAAAARPGVVRLPGRAPDDGEPGPDLRAAGADEGARQGSRLRGAARPRDRRRDDGRRHRRGLRAARPHRDAAGHRARAARAGDEARGRAVPPAAARQAARARCDGPADAGRPRRRRAPRRRDHRGDLREPRGEAEALRRRRGAREAGRDPRHQHLEPEARRHRADDEESRAARRPALLQPGAAAAARRSRQGRCDRSGARESAARRSCGRSTSCRCR